MSQFCQQIHRQKWRGYSGESITDIVTIGIGGSHLGAQMVVTALDAYLEPQLRSHFVANVDGADIEQCLRHLDPRRTLFIVASKTFTTSETLRNALTAKDWLQQCHGDAKAVAKHFVAITAKPTRAVEFGIAAANVFPIWDWVGGRYSLWSAMGLPIMLAIGVENYYGLLAGANDMDKHFRDSPFAENMPVLLALLGIWYINFFAGRAQVILPYNHNLRWFPSYLQQLDMESNGKTVTKQGQPVNYITGPMIWGQAGTNGQHSFYQLLHQGTHLIPADFIVPVHSHYPLDHHHEMLFANCLGQSQALMAGKSAAEVQTELASSGLSQDAIEALLPHKTMAGNHPSNTILMSRVTPATLGALIALYEHKVFVQGTIWGINSFDQWGVELGKQLANRVLDNLAKPPG